MSGFLLDPGRLVILGVVALLAFTTEGAIGFGGTVLAASIGAQFIPLDLLLPAFVPLNILLSAWLLGNGVKAIAWRMLVREVVPAVGIGAAIGLVLFHLPAKTALALAFGVFVVGLAALQLARPADKPLPRPAQLGFLALGGIAHGLFGTGGPMIVYVVRRRLADKRAFRATLAVLWLTLNIALLVNFASSHLYNTRTGEVGCVIALALVPGLFIGNRIHHRLEADKFERVVWLVLLLAGGALAVRSAFAL
ncbi:MAG TPA: sulfite exporter TauE/SafE family protein [Kofleriaceae bacterium]|nr:sulfite exporter TauE/SafE family protein [Kofleriaceae bacterium]